MKKLFFLLMGVMMATMVNAQQTVTVSVNDPSASWIVQDKTWVLNLSAAGQSANGKDAQATLIINYGPPVMMRYEGTYTKADGLWLASSSLVIGDEVSCSITKDNLVSLDVSISALDQRTFAATGTAVITNEGQNITINFSARGDIYGTLQTAVENVETVTKTIKRYENGQLVIEHNGKFDNALGAEVR